MPKASSSRRSAGSSPTRSPAPGKRSAGKAGESKAGAAKQSAGDHGARKPRATKRSASKEGASKEGANKSTASSMAGSPTSSRPDAGPGASPAPVAPSVGPQATQLEPDAALGRAVAVRRLELGLSRHDLAERARLSYPFICEIERGVKQPSSASLRALATALRLSPADLLARADVLAASFDRSSEPRETGDASGSGATIESLPSSAPPPSWRDPSGTTHRGGGNRAAPADDLSRLVRSMVRDELARLQMGGAPPPPRAAGGVAAGDEAIAPGRGPLASDEEVREHVLFAARQMLGSEEIEFDTEGDIPVKRGDVMLFIRVLDDPLSVLVFSPVLVGVDESPALFSRLNELNAGVHFIRFCVTHGGVVADIELSGPEFRPGLLVSACQAISEMAATTGPELQKEFGGRLFFGDEAAPKPPRDTGGYL